LLLLLSLLTLILLTGDGVPGAVSQLAYAARPASVTHVSHGTHVMAAACFLLLESSFLQVLLLTSTLLLQEI
jgi:hypothetical protein